MVYLDNAATTMLAPEVRVAMEPYVNGEFGNASSVHSLGRAARVALEDARETVARAIHAEPKEIIFTSGGTEANNAAIKGAIFKSVETGRSWNDIHIVTSRVEHHAVLEPIQWLSKFGAVPEFTETDQFGSVAVPSVIERIGPETALASLMAVNNETGATSPIPEIAEAVKKQSSALVHTDAVQAFGKMPIDVRAWRVDLLSISAHKIHGPKGIGALFVRAGTPWEPFLHGGAQERNRRGGTEAVALAVGFAEAIRSMASHAVMTPLERYLRSELSMIGEIVFHSPEGDRSIGTILNFTFAPTVLAKLDADALMIRYDLEGIAVSNGAACTSGSQQPSHVLLALGAS